MAVLSPRCMSQAADVFTTCGHVATRQRAPMHISQQLASTLATSASGAPFSPGPSVIRDHFDLRAPALKRTLGRLLGLRSSTPPPFAIASQC